MGGGCPSRVPLTTDCQFANGTKACCYMSQFQQCGPDWKPAVWEACPGGPFYKCVRPGTESWGCNPTPATIAPFARSLDDIPVMKYSRAARAFLQKYRSPALADFIEESVETAPDFDKYDDGKSSF